MPQVHEGATTRSKTIAKPCSLYKKMEKECQWGLLRDLRGGSYAMKEAAQKWLPLEKKESAQSYRARLQKNFLYPIFDDTICEIAGKPFSRNVILKKEDAAQEMVAALQLIEGDADGAGTTISGFASLALDDAIEMGMTHVLVEYAAAKPGQARSKEEEEENGLHPYFVHIKARDLIWWDWKMIDGQAELLEIRWLEMTEGDGAEGGKQRLRVMTSPKKTGVGTWEIWVENEGGTSREEREWVRFDAGEHTYPGIPLVTLYTRRVGYMKAKPPLLKLAEINLAHWQSNADQRTILHYARVPVLSGTGLSEKDVKSGVSLGVQEALLSTNENARWAWVEHNGNSIKAGEEDLKRLEERAEFLAMKPYTRQPSGDQTATEKKIDTSRSESDVQRWVKAAEEMLGNLYKIAAKWIKAELPAGFRADIFSEFQIAMRGSTDQSTLDAARLRGDLSLHHWLVETQRRGAISDDVTVEQIAEQLDVERALGLGVDPALAAAGGADPEEDPGTEPEAEPAPEPGE